ncbi:hypothetical protein [Streptomyces sp. NPDC096033]|uniref:ATP-dependent DNA ligase n=1 Tax=Streptomyces sp. NPDC096033 TaxID=3366071 RepID=UPI00380C1815
MSSPRPPGPRRSGPGRRAGRLGHLGGPVVVRGVAASAAARARGAAVLAAKWPACFVAFDVLQLGGQELLTGPYADRRALLKALFADHTLMAPWTLVPMTTDLAKAHEWLQTWTDISGVEGIVIKPLTGKYLPGYHGGWTRIRRRDTTEAVIGAITGTLTHPQLLAGPGRRRRAPPPRAGRRGPAPARRTTTPRTVHPTPSLFSSRPLSCPEWQDVTSSWASCLIRRLTEALVLEGIRTGRVATGLIRSRCGRRSGGGPVCWSP